MPTTTAVFRAIADFASLNREVAKSRRELAALQAQAGDTSAWDRFDAALGRVSKTQDKVATSSNKLATAERSATRTTAAHSRALTTATTKLTSHNTALRDLSTALDKVARSQERATGAVKGWAATEQSATRASAAHTRALADESRKTSSKATALNRLSRSLADVTAKEREAKESSQQHTNALNRGAGASRASATAHRSRASALAASARSAADAARDTDRLTASLTRAERAAEASRVGTYRVSQAYRDFGAGARQARSHTHALIGVLVGLILPGVVVGIQAIGGAAVSLVGALIGVVGAAGPAIGVLAAIGPTALTAAGAVGTVAAAFRGIGTALKAASAVEEQAATTAAASAKRRQTAARAVEDAQDSLRQAVQAQARAVEAAARSVEAANDRLVDANRDVLRAEEELHEARQQAIRDLKDLAEQVEDNALTVEGAEIGLLRAQERRQEIEADATSTALDRREAAHAVAEAEDRLADAVRQSGEDQQALTEAQRVGVEGSRVVRDASERVREAEEARADAAEELSLAIRDQTRVQQESAQQVARAQRQLRDAIAATAEAADQGSAAANKYAHAMSKLSPAGREFVLYLRSLLPLMDELSHAAQEALFPGLTRALQIIVPMVRSVAIPTVREFGRVMSELAVLGAETFRSWEADLLSFGTGAGPVLLEKFGHTAINVADALRHITMAAIPLTQWLADLVLGWSANFREMMRVRRESGELAAFFERTKETLRLFGSIVRNVGSVLFSVFQAATPMGQRLATTFRDMTKETADYLNTAEGMAKLQKYFDDLEPTVRVTSRLLSDMFFALAKMGTSAGALKTLLAIERELGPALGRLMRAIGQLTESLGPKFVTMLADFADAFAAILEAGGGDFFAAFVTVFATFATILREITEIPGIAKLAGWLLAIAGGLKAIKVVGAITGLTSLVGGLNRVAGGRAATVAGEKAVGPAGPATTFVGGLSRGISGQPTIGRPGPSGTRATGAPTATARLGAVVGSAARAPAQAVRGAVAGGAAAVGRTVVAPFRSDRVRRSDRGGGPGTVMAPPRQMAAARARSAQMYAPVAPTPLQRAGGAARRAGGAVGRGALATGRVVGATGTAIAGSIGGALAGGAIGQRIGGETGAMVGSIAGGVAGSMAPEALAAGMSKLGPLVDGAKARFAALATTLSGAVATAARASVGALTTVASGAGQAVSSLAGVVAAWGRAGVAAAASGVKQAAAWVVARGQAAATLVATLAQTAAGYVRVGLMAAASAAKQVLVATAMGVVRGAALAWAAAQWLLNAAMSANPIGILIVVIAALVAAFIYAWQNSETFRNIVKGAWEAIQAAAALAWTGIKVVFDAFMAGLQALGDFFVWVYQTFIKPQVDAWGIIISFTWNSVIKPVFNALMAGLRAVGDFFVWVYQTFIKPQVDAWGAVISTVWNKVIKPAWDAMGAGLDRLGGWFSGVVDGISRAWGRLAEIMKTPINFFINRVWNNGLLRGWNKISEWIPGLPKAQPLEPLATGGEVPGTGNRDSVPALLTPGEYVLSKPVVKQWGLENIDAAHLAARTPGRFPGLEGMFEGDYSKIYRVPGFAAGGAVDNAIRVARSMHGKRYVWGGTGRGGTDCSGYMAFITRALRMEGNPYRRIGTTSDFPWGGFQPGLKSAFGVGNVRGSHMRGTLAGVNVESGGSHNTSSYGGRAAGVPYGQNFHLPAAGGRFVGGGAGGGGGFNPLPGLVRSTIETITNPLINQMPKPPPHFYGMPRNYATMTRDKAISFLVGEAEKGYGAGGQVKGQGRDSVPAWLTPGEFVLNRRAVRQVGLPALTALNTATSGAGTASARPPDVWSRLADLLSDPARVSAWREQVEQQIRALEVTDEQIAQLRLHAAELFAPIGDALRTYIPQLSAALRSVDVGALEARLRAEYARRTGTPAPGAQSSDREVNVVMHVVNPTPEPASDTAARKLRTLAAMGAFS